MDQPQNGSNRIPICSSQAFGNSSEMVAKTTLAVGLLVLLASACEARDRQDVKDSVEVERAHAHTGALQFEKETDAINNEVLPNPPLWPAAAELCQRSRKKI